MGRSPESPHRSETERVRHRSRTDRFLPLAPVPLQMSAFRGLCRQLAKNRHRQNSQKRYSQKVLARPGHVAPRISQQKGRVMVCEYREVFWTTRRGTERRAFRFLTLYGHGTPCPPVLTLYGHGTPCPPVFDFVGAQHAAPHLGKIAKVSRRSFIHGLKTNRRRNQFPRRTTRLASHQRSQRLGRVARKAPRRILSLPSRLAAQTPRRPLGRCLLAQRIRRPQRHAHAAVPLLGRNGPR